MGVSNAAIKTFNSSGAQSVCRANTADDTKLIESQFLTKCTTEYINGTGETIIPGSLTTIPRTSSSNTGTNQDSFSIDSDIDAISSIDLTVEFNILQTIEAGGVLALVAKDFILSFINKVEIKMGGLTVQTIKPEEIFMRNLTELNQAYSSSINGAPSSGLRNTWIKANAGTTSTLATLPKQSSEIDSMSNVLSPDNSPLIVHADGAKYRGTVSIPFTGRTNNMRHSFLQAGAITNSLTVRVYYNKIEPNTPAEQGGSKYGLYSLIRLSGFQNITNFKTYLTVRNHIITETEKNFISGNIINRIVNTSQSVVREITTGETKAAHNLAPRNGNSIYTAALLNNQNSTVGVGVATAVTQANLGEWTITMDLSSVDINVSHILVAAFAANHTNEGVLHSSGAGYDSDIEWPPVGANTRMLIPQAELFSFSGYTIANKNKLCTDTGANMRGVLSDWLVSAELVIGSDRTGKIPATQMLNSNELFGLKSNNFPVYLIPIADSAFSTAGVPFSRLGNKKLILNCDESYPMTNGPFTSAKHDAELATAPRVKLAVVACGTQVQTTVGGTISFAS